MAVANRSALIEKLFKVLKKHYKVPANLPSGDLLSQFVFALILEQCPHDKALNAFTQILENSFDWNEVRVTTASELAEYMSGSLDPRRSARNVKRFLHSVFESQYSFDLEPLKKQNLGKTQSDLANQEGATPFAVSFVTQRVLGGHSIPLNQSALFVLYVCGIIDEKERDQQVAPGLDRAISKKQGVEFAALLHQLAIDLAHSPFSSRVRQILLEVHPDAKDRLPKRGAKKGASPAGEAAPRDAGTSAAKAKPKTVTPAPRKKRVAETTPKKRAAHKK
jgi:endonuclease-3